MANIRFTIRAKTNGWSKCTGSAGDLLLLARVLVDYGPEPTSPAAASERPGLPRHSL